jgi:hypothetical protein
MRYTSIHITSAVSPDGSVKSGFFALGEVAQKKLYTAEHIPSSPGEWGLIFALLPLPHAGVEIPPSLPGMAHGATIHASHHCSTGNCKMSRRLTTWAPLHLQLPGPGLGLRKGNLSKSMEIQFYGPKTDTAGEYISTNQQPVTIATIIHIIVRLFFTRERKLL